MADIFDEINKELKQDRQAILWQRYGKYIIAITLVIIMVVGLRQGFVYYKDNRTTQAANHFYTALTSDDPYQAFRDNDDALTDGYEMLAQFVIAKSLAESDRKSEAEQAYLDLSAREDIAPIYRDMALFLSVVHAPDAPDRSADALIDRLAPLIDTANPLQGLALEQAAALDLKLDRPDAAARKFERIINLPHATPSLQQRADQFLQIIDSKYEAPK